MNRFSAAEIAAVYRAMPDGAKPVAILCLGHVQAFYAAPMLLQEGWTHARPLGEYVFENRWRTPETPA